MKRALVIHNLENYRNAIEFQRDKEIDWHASLHHSIHHLLVGSYWEADELHISDDGCLHSFRFWFAKEGKKVGFDGGIICHGIGQQTFSVELNSQPGPHWSVHT